jgi:hypothetical protein
MGIGAGVDLAGKLLGGGDKGVSQWLIDEIRGQYQANRSTGFLPDETLWTKATQSSIDKILASLPSGMERFNTDLASRGIYSSGEAPKYMYQDVVAPVMREAGGALIQGKLGYAQAFQQGKIAEENMKMNYLNMLLSAMLNKQPGFMSSIGESLSGAGSMAMMYGLYGATK